MSNVTSTVPEPRTEAEYETAVKQMLIEMKHLHQQMDSNRKEIERLKDETRAILETWGVTI